MGEKAGSLVEQVLAQCAERCFTGVLTVRTSRGPGVVQFLSGVQEDAAYADMRGEEALAALSEVKVERWALRKQLPPIREEDPELPLQGDLARYSASELMRHCEEHALTGKLILEVEGHVLTATYLMGELAGLSPDTEEIADLLGAGQGRYSFELPSVTLPPLPGQPVAAGAQEELTAPGPVSLTGGELQQWADSAPPTPVPPPPPVAVQGKPPVAAPPAPRAGVDRPRVPLAPPTAAAAPPRQSGMRPVYLIGLAAVAMLVMAAVTFLVR